MKRILSLLLSACLVCGVLAGCGSEPLKFESLGIIMEDDKTITMDLDKENVKNMMGPPKSSDLSGDYEYMIWNDDFHVQMEFKGSRLISLYVPEAPTSPSATFGIACGESIDAVQQKLGKPMKLDKNTESPEDKEFLIYIFQRVDDHYEQFTGKYGSYEEFYDDYSKGETPGTFYYIVLTAENNCIDSLSIEALNR